MYSIKKKIMSLGMAGAMLLGAVGCAASAPATVGTVGGVEIPAGIYLLAQYNAYNTASNVAALATGETASDVKAVLKADCTGEINGEQVTATGSDYVARLTNNAIDYYAAVEKDFAASGATLSDTATAEAASTADSLWESNGTLYTANGIGKTTVLNYLLNSQKARQLLEQTYGENGTSPVSEDEYKDYIESECYYLESVELPLMDYSTYAFADDEQTTQIEALAAQCMADLQTTATAETAESTGSAVYSAAMTYVPQAMEILGSSMEAGDAIYYGSVQLYTTDDLSGYADTLIAPVEQAGLGNWVTVNMGTGLLVVRRINPLDSYSVEELVDMYGLLDALKSEEFQTSLYTEGAGLDHQWNAGALKTYAADKIKRSV